MIKKKFIFFRQPAPLCPGRLALLGRRAGLARPGRRIPCLPLAWSLWLMLFFALLLAGCGRELNMDQPAEDGNFHYRNKDLGFSLVLPPEFLYYQTQRKETSDFIDIEFFVPTSDLNYYQEVPGYAKPVVIRIFNKDQWQEIEKEGVYQKLGEKKSWWPGEEDKIYTIKFWGEAPVDWQGKWSEEMKQKVIDGFRVK